MPTVCSADRKLIGSIIDHQSNTVLLAFFLYIWLFLVESKVSLSLTGSAIIEDVIFRFVVCVSPFYSNPLYTGRLFHCYILDESICHFNGVGSILSLLFYFDGKSC